MANHMAEVAKMLGVELGERFKCDNGHKYELTLNGIKGIYDYPIDPQYEEEKLFNNMLVALLNGEHNITPKPWKPKIGENYWVIVPDGDISEYSWLDSLGGNSNYKLGNCYRTREEAEVNRDKWVAFYASDEVLEV